MACLGDLEYINILGQGRVFLNLARSSWVRSRSGFRLVGEGLVDPGLGLLFSRWGLRYAQNWMLGSFMISCLVMRPLERVRDSRLFGGMSWLGLEITGNTWESWG